VHAQNLFVDDGSNWEAVETISEGLPQLDVVPSLALVVETVDTIDGGTLVVTSQQEEVLGVLDLVSQQKADCFQTLLASVNVISQEEVVGIGWESSVLKQSE
jgi:hypothetical protein